MSKSGKVDVSAIILTFVVTSVTFYMYISNYFIYNNETYEQIKAMLKDVDIVGGKATVFMYGMFFVSLILFLVIGFIMYKIIFKLCSCKIEDTKLLIAVEMGFALSFFSGSLLVGRCPYEVVILVGNILEMILVIIMCFDNIKKKAWAVALIKGVIIVANILLSVFPNKI